MVSICDHSNPGTREGFILVSKAPPKRTRLKAERSSDGKREGRDGNGNGEARRAELADFLNARRAALQPADVGLPGGGRRRTPGLRREEVASLAGVGTTWYTWLEQGRDVRASLDVLEALARALKLRPAERAHLVTLGRGEQAPPPPPEREHVSATVRRLVENLDPSPAYLLGRRWDYLVWNRAVEVVFGDLCALPPGRRNHLWLMFMDPGRRELLGPEWEKAARRQVARFRADYANHVGDPQFDKLVDSLLEGSSEFRDWWSRHEVASSGEGRKEILHPMAGKLVFEHAMFRHGENPEHRLLLYSPLPDEDTPARLERLLRQA
ncbi:MAG TPA: helix-turn-helix transcriptional regulator [Thermoleophilaceae bacterium]